ncbi:MAG: translation initiation factor IF-2 [Candidatus Micrarchaeota archaeon]|nr:translation initiation factor IF-2 [Candidatus Micrarchaeota archaeon]
MALRQPIVVVMGHVDHGKTSLLDAIRKTNIAKKEAGAITQHIGASEISLEDIKEACHKAVKTLPSFSIPGLLFIDTPGHEAFTHLRQRGGSIADIAILVVDITQGFQPQTKESIMILKEFKTPFVVAANKIDLIDGWKTQDAHCSIISAIERQSPATQMKMDELLYKIVGELAEFGINSERFDRVKDFTRQVAILPVSAKTSEGLAELLLAVAGLSQRFLEKELARKEDQPGKGTVLEVKEEKGLGTTIDVIVYEGRLRKNDEIVFGTINGAAKVRIRGLLKPKLKQTDKEKYEYVDEVTAACGVKIYAPGLEGALAGSPFVVAEGGEAEGIAEIEGVLKSIIEDSEKNGLIVKADTLGSLEALRKLLSAHKLEIKRAAIGKVTRKDVVDASVVAANNPYLGAIIAFNVDVEEEVREEAAFLGVKIFSSPIIYSLCEEYINWVEEQKKSQAKEAIERLPLPAKLLVLPGCIFRSSKPAIFGIEVVAGRLKKGVRLMKADGQIIGQLKEIQRDGKGVQLATKGQQVAISVEGAVCGKTVSENDYLYTYITPKEAEEIESSCKAQLEESEISLLYEIVSMTKRDLI